MNVKQCEGFKMVHRNLYLAFLVVLLCASISGANTSKAWEFSSDVEGWTGENFSTQQNQHFRWYSGGVHTGVLVGTPSNSDPRMLSPNSGWSVVTNPSQTVTIRIRADGSGSRWARLYWRASGQSFAQERSIGLQYNAASGESPGYRQLTFNVGSNSGWQGQIVQLRLDPIDDGGNYGHPVYVDYVRITGVAPTITVVSPNGGGTPWTAGNNHTVTWTSTNLPSEISIALYKGGTGPAFLVSSAQWSFNPNTGNKSVPLPSTLAQGSDYKIGVAGHGLYNNIYDFSDNYFTINAAPSTIDVSPTSLSPVTQQGQNATNQTFTLSNTGSGSMSFSLSKDVHWLTVSPSSGSLAAGASRSISVSYSTSSLTPTVPPNYHTGRISISAPGATNTPLNYNVYLTVNAASPTISVSPTSLSPVCQQGQNATSQTFTLSNTGSGTMNYAISKAETWLSLSPSSGSLAAGASHTITVSYSTSSLSPTVPPNYHISPITISALGATNTPLNYNIYLTVNASIPHVEINTEHWTGTRTGTQVDLGAKSIRTYFIMYKYLTPRARI